MTRWPTDDPMPRTARLLIPVVWITAAVAALLRLTARIITAARRGGR